MATSLQNRIQTARENVEALTQRQGEMDTQLQSYIGINNSNIKGLVYRVEDLLTRMPNVENSISNLQSQIQGIINEHGENSDLIHSQIEELVHNQAQDLELFDWNDPKLGEKVDYLRTELNTHTLRGGENQEIWNAIYVEISGNENMRSNDTNKLKESLLRTKDIINNIISRYNAKEPAAREELARRRGATVSSSGMIKVGREIILRPDQYAATEGEALKRADAERMIKQIDFVLKNIELKIIHGYLEQIANQNDIHQNFSNKVLGSLDSTNMRDSLANNWAIDEDKDISEISGDYYKNMIDGINKLEGPDLYCCGKVKL